MNAQGNTGVGRVAVLEENTVVRKAIDIRRTEPVVHRSQGTSALLVGKQQQYIGTVVRHISQFSKIIYKHFSATGGECLKVGKTQDGAEPIRPEPMNAMEDESCRISRPAAASATVRRPNLPVVRVTVGSGPVVGRSLPGYRSG